MKVSALRHEAEKACMIALRGHSLLVPESWQSRKKKQATVTFKVLACDVVVVTS